MPLLECFPRAGHHAKHFTPVLSLPSRSSLERKLTGGQGEIKRARAGDVALQQCRWNLNPSYLTV